METHEKKKLKIKKRDNNIEAISQFMILWLTYSNLNAKIEK